MSKATFPSLTPDLQVGFFYKLKNIKDLYFHEALSKTVKNLRIPDIDSELGKYVSNEALQKLASFSIRGEAFFPIPIILRANPFLLGYYRLLLGFSQKEFYSKGPFGRFRHLESTGKISPNAVPDIVSKSLITSAEFLVKEIHELSMTSIAELQILTAGPQLRGSKNNEYGRVATEKTFDIIKTMVQAYSTKVAPKSIELTNDSGRGITIRFASDPDIVISEKLSKKERILISIEIKGGRDVSNIHNRIGEAEKSHQKARVNGCNEFMTIISVDADYLSLQTESPTTSHFFHLDQISDPTTDEHTDFRDILSSMMSIKI